MKKSVESTTNFVPNIPYPLKSSKTLCAIVSLFFQKTPSSASQKSSKRVHSKRKRGEREAHTHPALIPSSQANLKWRPASTRASPQSLTSLLIESYVRLRTPTLSIETFEVTVTGGLRVSEPKYLNFCHLLSNQRHLRRGMSTPFQYPTDGAREGSMPRDVVRMGGCVGQGRPIRIIQYLGIGKVGLIEADGGNRSPRVILLHQTNARQSR